MSRARPDVHTVPYPQEGEVQAIDETSDDGRATSARITGVQSRLQAQLAELEARQDRVASDLAEPLDRDSDEAAIEKEDDESLEAQGLLIAREIESVKRALARLQDGTYGICVRCGGDIAAARLEARPEAALCIDCARGNERS